MSDRRATRIVVAEDDAASRILLTRQLRKVGYEVIACENGSQALEAIRQEVSCIVVADWLMPGMDGLELCRAVRSLSKTKALAFVYFILLTAHSEKDHIVAGFEAGADDYLTKPYHRQELLARLRAGERVYALQIELMQRQIQLHRVNGELAALNQKLEKLANTDALTNLANRRHLFERFGETWALAERGDHPLSCIMFDIDKFKSVNDTHGHAAGDQVLKHVAGVVRSCVRRYDLLGRIGGEEFCVICPETALEGGAVLAERIREAVGGSSCPWKDVQITVTVSLGVAGRAPSHDDTDALISAADRMLYRAKDNGRDQVWVCGPDGQARRLETAAAF